MKISESRDNKQNMTYHHVSSVVVTDNICQLGSFSHCTPDFGGAFPYNLVWNGLFDIGFYGRYDVLRVWSSMVICFTWVKCPVSEEKLSTPYLQPNSSPSSYQPSTAAWYRSPPILGRGCEDQFNNNGRFDTRR